METMRENWTDKLLDEFRENTDRRFDQVDHRFDAVDRRFDEVDRVLHRIDTDRRALRNQMAAFQRTILQVGGGVTATTLVGFTSLLLTQL
jgi:hypothetical protein